MLQSFRKEIVWQCEDPRLKLGSFLCSFFCVAIFPVPCAGYQASDEPVRCIPGPMELTARDFQGQAKWAGEASPCPPPQADDFSLLWVQKTRGLPLSTPGPSPHWTEPLEGRTESHSLCK